MDERRHSDLLGYRVYRTQRMLAQCLEDALARYGITPGQWNALNQLDKRGPLSQRALADALQRKPATITRSIDKMEEMGLVERVPDATDRRANVIVCLLYTSFPWCSRDISARISTPCSNA